MDGLSKTLSQTVNGNNKFINTVNSLTVEEEISKVIEDHNIKPEGVGMLLAEGLDDLKSIKYFQLLAQNNNPAKLLEALHITKEAKRNNSIRKGNLSKYFLGILYKWGFNTKFRESGQ